MKYDLNRQNGFTLIELIMVIAVLGILAGIAIPRISGVQDKARYAAGETSLANMKTPLELYRVETGSYPDVEDYEELKIALTGENGYLDNMQDILPKSSNNDWHYHNYSLENDGSYTLVITHPNLGKNLEITPDGIEKIDDNT